MQGVVVTRSKLAITRNLLNVTEFHSQLSMLQKSDVTAATGYRFFTSWFDPLHNFINMHDVIGRMYYWQQ